MLLVTGEADYRGLPDRRSPDVEEATGSNLAPYGFLGLAAFRGDTAGTSVLLDAIREDVTQRGEGVGITFAEWANTLLNNGLGRYRTAEAAAQRATTVGSTSVAICTAAAV